MEGERRKVGRKLLVASLGVASVSYLGCGGKTLTPQKIDASTEDAANVGAADVGADTSTTPDDVSDAGAGDAAGDADAALDRQFVGNLIP